jgi:hypothetical protein
MKTKFYSMYASTTDSNGGKHIVTVVGKFEQNRQRQVAQEIVPVELKENSVVEGMLIYPTSKFLNRRLTLGLSICHPYDTFDEEKGVEIAKSRIEKGETLGSIETSDVTMLTEDAIMAEIVTKLNHVCNTIDEYLP